MKILPKLLRKKKKFFFNTTKGFYEWKSDFEIAFPGKTMSATSPEAFGAELDEEEPTHITFDLTSTDGFRKIKIKLGEDFDDNFYEVQGEDETWVRGVKDKIEEIINSRDVARPSLHRGLFKFSVSLLSAALLLYTLFSILRKLSWLTIMSSQSVFLWLTILVSLIIFIFVLIQGYWFLNSQFPYIQLAPRKQESVKIGVVLTILLGLLTNLIYDLTVQLLK